MLVRGRKQKERERETKNKKYQDKEVAGGLERVGGDLPRGAVRRDASRVLVGRETLENPGYAKHRKTALQARTLGGTRN